MTAKLTVVSGGSAEQLAELLSTKLGASLVRATVDVFVDGESKITINGTLSSEETVIVQSIYPPVDTNLMRAFLLISKASEYSDRVIAIVPYMGYARQDREFLPGEIITTKVLAKLFKGAGASEIIVVDIHSIAGIEHFEIKRTNVTAIPDLLRYFTDKADLKNPLVVSPDQGGKERIREAAEASELEYVALTKDRDRKTGNVEIVTEEVAKAISGRDVLLVDDMISTGGSIIKAAQFLKKHNCARIYVACTHGLLVGDAYEKIMNTGVVKEIISSNTVPGKTAVVDVSDVIVDAVTSSSS